MWVINDKADEGAAKDSENGHGDFAEEIFVAGIGHEAPAHDNGGDIECQNDNACKFCIGGF